MTKDRGDRPPSEAPSPSRPAQPEAPSRRRPAQPEAAAAAVTATAEPIPDARAPIGQQIRELRRARGLKLADLAAATGRSIGNLSEMERGKSPIAIQSLDGIARALDVSLNWFFTGTAVAPPEERDVVVRRGARRELNLAQAGAREELLSPHLAGTLEMILTTFAPGAHTGDAPRRRRGEEGGMVLSGRLELHADGRVHLLEEGDSFQLPGAGEHWCRNPGERDAVVMWIIAPADY